MCSVLIKFLRPSKEVAEALPNTTAQQRLEDLIATHLGRTERQGNNFESVFFTSVTIPGVILSCARRNCIVREEGHPDALWGIPVARAPWGDFQGTPVAQELTDGQVLDVAGTPNPQPVDSWPAFDPNAMPGGDAPLGILGGRVIDLDRSYWGWNGRWRWSGAPR